MYQEDFSASAPPTNRWTWEETKRFEDELGLMQDTANWWQQLGDLMGKTETEVTKHYNMLVHDVMQIDAGRVDVDDFYEPSWDDSNERSGAEESVGQFTFRAVRTKHGEPERKKGLPWTEEEHKLFLIGLERYGKGDWRSISRNAVVTRTPTQVASHAQKYFLRQSTGSKERKRSSIHDITTVDTNVVPVSNQNNWILPAVAAPVHQPLLLPPPVSHLPKQEVQSGYPNGDFPLPDVLPVYQNSDFPLQDVPLVHPNCDLPMELPPGYESYDFPEQELPPGYPDHPKLELPPGYESYDFSEQELSPGYLDHDFGD